MNKFKLKILSLFLALFFICNLMVGAEVIEDNSIILTVDKVEEITKNYSENFSGEIKGKEIKSVTYSIEAEIDNGQAFVKDQEVNVNKTKWSIKDAKLKPGNNTITIRARNSHGKTVEESFQIYYDMGSFQQPNEESIVIDKESQIEYVNDELLLIAKDGVSKEKINEIIKSVDGEIIGEIYLLNEYQIKVEASNLKELEEKIEILQSNEDVSNAMINSICYPDEIVQPIDPWGGNQIWNEETPGGANWGVEAIQAPSAWKYNDELSEVIVGIVDNGFDLNHDDVEISTALTSVQNFKSSHGTHVAGTVGATANNNKGVTGINWKSKIYAGPCGPAPNSYLTVANIQKNTVSLVMGGAKVLNGSFGSSSAYASSYYSEKLLDTYGASANATIMGKLLDAGYDFIFVQSAGNGSSGGHAIDARLNGTFCGIDNNTKLGDTNASIEDINDRILVVGAAYLNSDGTYIQAGFSNGGPNVDICAPGSSVYSCEANNTYSYKSGTSMAAPHVTGVVSLVWSVNPNFTGAEVRDIVLNNTRDVVKQNPNTKYTSGTYNMVNAKLAVEAALEFTSDRLIVRNIKSDKGNEVNIGENITLNTVIKGGEGEILYTFESTNPNGETKTLVTETVSSNYNTTLDIPGKYTFYVTAVDSTGKKSEAKTTINVIDPKAKNQVVIYYNGYTDPYIHYKLDGGSWTKAPGEKMESSSEREGFNYKKVIDLGTASNVTACFNNGNNQWQNNGGSDYVFTAGVYEFSNAKAKNVSDNFDIATFTSKRTSPIFTNTEVEYKATTKNALGKVYYKFSILYEGSNNEVVVKDFSLDNNNSFNFTKEGKHKLIVYGKDSSGSIAKRTIDIVVESKKELSIDSITCDKGVNIKYGDTANISINAVGGSGKYTYNLYVKSNLDENEILLEDSSINKAAWKPKEAVNYTIYAEVIDSEGSRATSSLIVNVNEVLENEVTIYYKGYASPYIHYKIDGGIWTTAPGVKMEANNDVEGYNYRAKVILGEAEGITVCFNNGSGNWDSNNGNNYYFKTGYYTFSSGKITKISEPKKEFLISSFTTSPENKVTIGSTVSLSSNVRNNKGVVNYKYAYKTTTNEEIIISDYSTKKDIIWEPIEKGTYTLIVYAMDSDGTVLTKEKQFIVQEEGIEKNEVTIYYKGYTSPYIHYKIDGGTWTTAPGLKMEATNELIGYTHKITIDLGNSKGVTACFNNGSGNWDSNNGKNYYFAKGSYMYYGGSINEIRDNKVTIYYKGYDNAYIHYKIGNTPWTAAPGIKMERTSELAGYTHKITIELGNESILTACFNNGYGTWDSNNGSNYIFTSGVYTYSGGTKNKISEK